MRFLSLFSGVGGFDLGLELAGHECIGQVEINSFCQRVLGRHWPLVARWSDVRKWESNGHEPIDLLVGGFPCQDLSVAGKRAGLSGERSGLFWEIVRIAKELRPTYLLLENVPGLMSSNDGKDIQIVIDALAECGYIVDVDELDSQYFGVPQRRRRLFFIGTSASSGLLSKTHFSENTRISFLAQSLLDALELLTEPFTTDSTDSASSPSISTLGLTRRMLCCENLQGRSLWLNFPDALNATLLACANMPNVSDFQPGANGHTATDIESGQGATGASGSISKLWRRLWEDLSVNQNASTILTWSRLTTTMKILSCAEICLNICKHIGALKPSCPFCWNAASSVLTALEKSMSSLETIADDLFAEETFRHRARLLLEEADSLFLLLESSLTAASQSEILLESTRSSGDFTSGREAGEKVAATLRSRTKKPGVNMAGRGGEDDVNLIFQYHGSNVGEMGTLRSGNGALTGGVPFVTHTLTGEGFDASEDGTGRRTPLIFQPKASSTQSMNLSPLAPSLGTTKEVGILHQGVRRLTPVECSRLQGFPDDWLCLCGANENLDACTCPDSPRYRALGNAVTVPVIEWFGNALRKIAT